MTAEQIIEQVQTLPAMPESVLKLVHLLNRPTQHNQELVKTVACDAALTAGLLRACNSAYYGSRDRVGSVEQAVLILGHQEIFRLIMALSLGGPLSGPLAGYGIEDLELWRHSLTTALAAQLVVGASSGVDVAPSVAFTAGLLHDIGKLVLNHAFTLKVQAAIRARIETDRVSRIEAEKAVLGVDHCEVGACLLEKWRFPAAIVEAVAHHHAPVLLPVPQLSAVAHVANCAAHLIGSAPGWDSYAVRVEEEALQSLGIGRKSLECLIVQAHESLSDVNRFLAM